MRDDKQTNEQLKIELLSQWKLEAESRNFHLQLYLNNFDLNNFVLNNFDLNNVDLNNTHVLDFERTFKPKEHQLTEAIVLLHCISA